MKKVLLLLMITGLSFLAQAQEEIPLFFDTENTSAPQSETPLEGAARTAVESEAPPRKVGQPRIGRNAKPLDSLILVPLPNDNVSIQLNDKPVPAPQPVRRRSASKQEVITRSNPVAMTESGDLSDAYLQSLLSGMHVSEKRQIKRPAVAFGERYDARSFAVADLMLGMTPEEIVDTAAETGYAVKKVSYGIPEKYRASYEADCRAMPIYLPELIRNCIVEKAKEADTHHVTQIDLVKPLTQEYVTVWFSSHATDNEAYKIYYLAKGDNSLNFNRPNMVKKMARKDHFWRQVFQTYGMPDDGKNLIWGDWNTAYLQAQMHGSAYDASLVLEDRTIPWKDDEALAEEASYDIPNPSPFTFSDKGDD